MQHVLNIFKLYGTNYTYTLYLAKHYIGEYFRVMKCQPNHIPQLSILDEPSNSHSPSSHKYETLLNGIISFNRKKLLRNIIGIIIIILTSTQVRTITMEILEDSRQLNRALNYNVLQHDDLNIYWFGYLEGQYLLNYPIQEYFVLEDVRDMLVRMQAMMGNLDGYLFGKIDQKSLNKTSQYILIQNKNGLMDQYKWTIQKGISQPFNQEDISSLKQCLLKVLSVQIRVDNIQVQQKNINIKFVIQPYADSSIFVRIFFDQDLNIGSLHINTLIAGIVLLSVTLHTIKSKNYQIDVYYLPDFLLSFFLVYSSTANMLGNITFRYGILLDGITCFISWLWALKFFTHEDDYHISFLIKKSYILVGRLFVSFGPLFIAFVLFAVTVFCRYADLFDNLHKGFISIFCVCYYNMTYQQFRSTQRISPLSAIFFTTLVLMFTACIYSGLLVSVFCSYIWNKREEETKGQLLSMLKIQCAFCQNKYSYSEGKQGQQEQALPLVSQQNLKSYKIFENSVKSSLQFLQKNLDRILKQNERILESRNPLTASDKIAIDQYKKMCKTRLEKCKKITKSL